MSNKTTTLIGSDKGGVGKSLVAQIMIVAHDQAGAPLKVVEIDNQRTLSTVFGDRVDLSMDPSVAIEKANGDRRALHNHFGPVYDVWASGDSITDLGANVTTPLVDWMDHADVHDMAIEDDIGFRFVAVAIPDDQSLRSAASALDQARRRLGDGADLVLVLNDISGMSGFSPYGGTETWDSLMAMRESHGVRIVNLPHCESAIMDWIRAWGLTVVQILDAPETLEAIAQKAGFTRIQRRQEVNLFLDWLRAVQDAMHPLFVPRPDPAMRTAAE